MAPRSRPPADDCKHADYITNNGTTLCLDCGLRQEQE